MSCGCSPDEKGDDCRGWRRAHLIHYPSWTALGHYTTSNKYKYIWMNDRNLLIYYIYHYRPAIDHKYAFDVWCQKRSMTLFYVVDIGNWSYCISNIISTQKLGQHSCRCHRIHLKIRSRRLKPNVTWNYLWNWMCLTNLICYHNHDRASLSTTCSALDFWICIIDFLIWLTHHISIYITLCNLSKEIDFEISKKE